MLLSCDSINYAPPVTPQMVATSSKEEHAGLATLREGRNLFVHRCIECHTLPPLWHYSTEDWPEILSSMAHRASLKPPQREAILSYILAVRSER